MRFMEEARKLDRGTGNHRSHRRAARPRGESIGKPLLRQIGDRFGRKPAVGQDFAGCPSRFRGQCLGTRGIRPIWWTPTSNSSSGGSTRSRISVGVEVGIAPGEGSGTYQLMGRALLELGRYEEAVQGAGTAARLAPRGRPGVRLSRRGIAQTRTPGSRA